VMQSNDKSWRKIESCLWKGEVWGRLWVASSSSGLLVCQSEAFSVDLSSLKAQTFPLVFYFHWNFSWTPSYSLISFNEVLSSSCLNFAVFYCHYFKLSPRLSKSFLLVFLSFCWVIGIFRLLCFELRMLILSEILMSMSSLLHFFFLLNLLLLLHLSYL
jgi:hypothetical protein